MFLRVLFCLCLSLRSVIPVFAAEQHTVTLTVALDATWPPMEFFDADHKPVGYSIDYITAVAKEAGFSIVFKNFDWDSLFAELAAGRCDVISSSVSITPERKKIMDFSLPYAEIEQAVIVRKNSPITEKKDLQGKLIGAGLGSTGYFAVRGILMGKPKSYTNVVGLAMTDLSNGLLDAVVCDSPVAADYLLKNAEGAAKLKIAFAIKDVPVEEYGFVVRKGDKETLALLNKGISLVKASGVEAQLQKKWFGK